MNEEDFYEKRDWIFRLTALSGGIGNKLKESTKDFMNKEDLFVYEYIPTKGRDAGKEVQYLLYKGQKVTYLNNYISVDNKNKVITKLEGVTNIIANDWWQGIANEGGVTLNNGKKPEKLLELVINTVTQEGDYVLDSFLGSGTTCVGCANLNRNFIGIELQEEFFDISVQRVKECISNE